MSEEKLLHTTEISQIGQGFKVEKSSYNHAKAAYRTTNTDVIIRDDFNRTDYEFLRPDSEIPENPKLRIIACLQAYDKIGIIRNIIDMMGDFVCKGIDLAHKTKVYEKFYKEWWKRIGGKERSERIANLLYRAGNVVIKRSYAQLTQNESDNLKSGKMLDGQIITSSGPKKRNSYRIPWDYTIMNPASLEVLGGDLAPLLGRQNFTYGVRLDKTMIDQIREANAGLKKGSEAFRVPLPSSLLNFSDEKKPNIFYLDKNDTIPLFYKKDDWQVWATPMTFPLLPDLQVYVKLRLTDLSALDGACNYLRIIKLGDIEGKIWPAEGSFEKMSSILSSNSAGGPIDIVWGPDIDILESKTDIADFLTNDKYVPTLNAIYSGLGIPPALTGISGSSGQTFSNSFITLKTLIERLEYVRNIIVSFWENELNLLAKEMGFSSPAQLVFEHPTITDESIANKLLIELLDRNLISEQAVMERTNFYSEIENARKLREVKLREKGKMPQKVSALQIPENQTDSVDNGGRELGQKDSVKRKTRKAKPRTRFVSQATAWAIETQEQISDILTPIYLKAIGKSNLRQLTDQEFDSLESIKFDLLYNAKPGDVINEDFIKNNASKSAPQDVILDISSMTKGIDKIDKVRNIKASYCAMNKLSYFDSVFNHEGEKNG